MNTPTSEHSFFAEHIKPHAPAYITSVATSLLFISSMIFNYSGQAQHSKDVQVAQGQQIEDNRAQIKNLQEQLNKVGTVVAVIDQFKGETGKRLDRIESLLLQEIRSHKQIDHQDQ